MQEIVLPGFGLSSSDEQRERKECGEEGVIWIASLILPFPAISITEKLTDFWTRSLDRRVAIYSDRPRNIVVSESRSPRYGDM